MSLCDQILALITGYGKDNQDFESLPDAFSVEKGRVLYEGSKPVRQEMTTKHGGKIDGPRFIIIHYTANGSTQGTVNVFKKYSVSAHLVVGRDAEVVQMVPFDTQAWHAGISSARSKWGTKFTSLNRYAIGIELVNYGYDANHVPDSVDTSGWKKAQHKNERSSRLWQPYSEEQVETTTDIVAALMKSFEIPIEHVLGHDDISPDRKVDPGPLFPMAQLKSKLGERQ